MQPTPWYKIEVNEDRLLGGEYHRLCRRFQRAFIAAGAPREMALLAEMHPLAPRRAVYLSPEAVRHAPDLVADHAADPCAAPELGGVTVVFGVPGAKEHLMEQGGPHAPGRPAMEVVPGGNVIPLSPRVRTRTSATGT